MWLLKIMLVKKGKRAKEKHSYLKVGHSFHKYILSIHYVLALDCNSESSRQKKLIGVKAENSKNVEE